MVFADEALFEDTHSPKQSTADSVAQEGILHNRSERALVRNTSKGDVSEAEPLNAFDKTRPLDDIEVIRKRSTTRRPTSDALQPPAPLILGMTLRSWPKMRDLPLQRRKVTQLRNNPLGDLRTYHKS